MITPSSESVPAGTALAVMADVTILIIQLLIVSGLRISELTNLKIRDVSPDACQTFVNGKGSRERVAFVPNRELQEEFRRFLEAATRKVAR